MSKKENPSSSPSLFSTSGEGRGNQESGFEDTRILFALEGKGNKENRKERRDSRAKVLSQNDAQPTSMALASRRWLIPVLLVAGVCIAGIISLNRSGSNPETQSAPTVASTPVAVQASVPTTSSSSTTQEPAPATSAKIINEVPNAAAPSPESAPAPSTPLASLSEANMPKTAEPKMAHSSPAATTKTPVTVKKTAPPVKNKTSPTAKSQAVASNSAPEEKAKLPAKRADVDLIAALMTHIDKNSTFPVETEDGQPKTPVTLADLVKSCDKLGGRDARVCKERVCESHWNKEPACKK